MRNRSIVCAVLCVVLIAMVSAGEPSETEKRRDIIRYGIESEILDLVDTLQTEKEDGLNKDLLAVLVESRSPKLREALLKFFSAREWNGAVTEATAIVDGRDEEIASSVMAALSYLSAVKAKEGIGEAKEILADQEKKYLTYAVRLLGRAGSEEDAQALLDIFESDESTDALKQEAVLALGEIRANVAVEKLIEIVEGESAGKVMRMYASDALGKIGDVKAIPSLVKAANGDDPQVRAYAVGALGNFSSSEAQSAIVQGLRDGTPAVRVAAIKSASKVSIKEAQPFIRYRARNDPEKGVREEALKAIGGFGGHENTSFLREYLEDKKMNAGSRATAFAVLLDTDAVGSRSVLEDALKAEASGKDTAMLKAFLGALSKTSEKAAVPLIETYLLKSSDFTARIAGIDWVRRNKVVSLKPVVAALAETDPVESVKKRAAAAMESL